MTERQISDGLCAYLYKNGLMFIRARTDQKSTIVSGWPDITICHGGRCLLIELKALKGKTSFAQDRVIENLRANGNNVVLARSVEQAISAVQAWLGLEKPENQPQVKLEGAFVKRSRAPDLWIGSLFGTDYVFRGSSVAGSTVEQVRRATAEDIRNLPRR